MWACELVENTAGPGFLEAPPTDEATSEAVLEAVGYSIDNTTKTRAVFEINKGVNKHPEITVNDHMALENRRVPIENMIYVADGPSDVPVFSILNQYGGKTFAVYNPQEEKEFRQVLRLQEQGRVQGLGPADYVSGGHTARWLMTWAEDIASRMVDRREQALGESLGKPPSHIVPAPAGPEAPQDEVSKHDVSSVPHSDAPTNDTGSGHLRHGERPPATSDCARRLKAPVRDGVNSEPGLTESATVVASSRLGIIPTSW